MLVHLFHQEFYALFSRARVIYYVNLAVPVFYPLNNSITHHPSLTNNLLLTVFVFLPHSFSCTDPSQL